MNTETLEKIKALGGDEGRDGMNALLDCYEKKYIDADELIKEFCKWFHKDSQEADERDDLVADIVFKIENQPAADVAEVVHCKDCKYLTFSDCYGECGKGKLGIVMPNDFCSRGERKDNVKKIY